jgi:hypothetical protein
MVNLHLVLLVAVCLFRIGNRWGVGEDQPIPLGLSLRILTLIV